MQGLQVPLQFLGYGVLHRDKRVAKQVRARGRYRHSAVVVGPPIGIQQSAGLRIDCTTCQTLSRAMLFFHPSSSQRCGRFDGTLIHGGTV